MNLLLSTLFSSETKTRLLNVLCVSRVPLSLRRLSLLAERPIRSIALAALQLEEQGVISHRMEKNRTLYSLHPTSPNRALLESIFDLATFSVIRERSKNYRARAQSLLSYQVKTAQLLRKRGDLEK